MNVIDESEYAESMLRLFKYHQDYQWQPKANC